MLKLKLIVYLILWQVINANILLAAETSDSEADYTIQDAEKIIVKLGDKTHIPSQTKLSKLDSSVFFVNTSNDKLLTLAIAFGKRKAHCASDNMKWSRELEALVSVDPIAPKDFAVMCFPESGVYNVLVYGLRNDNSAISTQVVVP